MSRGEIERACFELRNRDDKELFQRDPQSYLARFRLSAEERSEIAAGDVGALAKRGVVFGALDALGRTFSYDNEAYVRRLRSALSLDIRDDQIDLLRRRAAAKKGL